MQQRIASNFKNVAGFTGRRHYLCYRLNSDHSGTQDLFELIDLIRRKKASLKSLKDTWLNLSEDNPYSQFLITVMAGVNQLERDLIRMRQREGIELTKKEGKFKGRLKKYHKNHAGMNYAVKLYKEGGMTVNQICEITNVSRASLYRNLSERNK